MRSLPGMIRSTRAGSPTSARALGVVVTAVFLAIGFGGRTTFAHTDFESSSPSDGETVTGPVSQITVTFTNPAVAAGEGFSALDSSGAVRMPTSIEVVDDRVFVLTFDPPLAAGPVAVRWEVRAGDAHPIDGSFTFTSTSPPPTSPPPTTPPPSEPTEPTGSIDVAPASPTTTSPTTTSPIAPSTTAPSPTTTATTAAAAAEPDDLAPPAATLDEFLAGDADRPGTTRQLVGRAISIPAAIAAIGTLAFLAATLRGTARELALLLRCVASVGAALVVGGTIEYSGWLAASGESFGGAWTSTPGAAMALRGVGGVWLAVGALAAASALTRMRSRAPALSAAVAHPRSTHAASRTRWSIRTAPLLSVGSVALVASFWFDGHTVSRGPRIVHVVVNGVHVTAAAVWVGGVIALALILWLRRRRDEPTGATELIVRFSSIATIALVAVTLAGAVMAWLILDRPGDVIDTEWGRTYLLKVGAVGVAAVAGAYNHFRLRPELERLPDDPALAAEFRSVLVAEAIVLVFVAVVTAWLVAAAT